MLHKGTKRFRLIGFHHLTQELSRAKGQGVNDEVDKGGYNDFKSYQCSSRDE